MSKCLEYLQEQIGVFSSVQMQAESVSLHIKHKYRAYHEKKILIMNANTIFDVIRAHTFSTPSTVLYELLCCMNF